MKNFFKSLLLSLAYFAIYFASQILAIIIISAYFAINSAIIFGNINQINFENLIINKMGIILVVSSLISLIIYVLIFKIRDKSFMKNLSFKRIPVKYALFLSLFSICISLFTISLVNILTPVFPDYSKVSQDMATGMNSILGILAVVLFAPIFEEILFRGLIFKELYKSSPLWLSLILQAIIFGVAHGNKLQFIYTFILGLALALTYHWSNSIITPIILHCTYNILGTLLVPMLVYYTQNLIYVYMVLGGIGSIVLMMHLYKIRPNNSSEMTANSIDIQGY